MGGVALITGASSGLGAEFARLAAAEGYSLILTARRRDRLDTLAAELKAAHKTRVRVIEADLAQPGAAMALWNVASNQGAGEIDILVNNAGLGAHGRFGADPAREDMANAVNITAYTELLRAAALHMTPRGSGRILNVASLAAFMPGPNMASYHASKAYALSLSDAVHDELRGTGIHVTALCPGATRTEFFEAANVSRTWLMTLMPMGTAEGVALAGWRAMKAGRKRVVPGALNKLTACLARIVPARLLGPLTGWLLSANK